MHTVMYNHTLSPKMINIGGGIIRYMKISFHIPMVNDIQKIPNQNSFKLPVPKS